MGMGVKYNYGLLVFMLIFTCFLLLLMHINHSRETRHYRILKLSVWILLANQLLDIFRAPVWCGDKMYPSPVIYLIFVAYYLTAATVMILIVMYMLLHFPQLAGRSQLLHTVSFLCECTAAVLILPTNLTGFVYSISGDRFISGIAEDLFFWMRLIVLIGFFIVVWSCRRRLAPKLFQNWMAMLVLAIGIKYYNASGDISFMIGQIKISFSGIAAGALVGIILNAILPGKDYEFEEME